MRSWTGELAIAREPPHTIPIIILFQLFFRNKTATAIQIVNSDGKRIVRSEQVVLAAGAINTPKLLLLSGIGNSVDLKNLTIPVVADSPGVGLNLYDHLNFPLYASIEAPISLTISKLLSVTELFRYLIHKTGRDTHHTRQ